MRAQSKVVQETPMEKHGRIDEGATVEVEDEFAVGSALRPFDRLRGLGVSSCLKTCISKAVDALNFSSVK